MDAPTLIAMLQQRPTRAAAYEALSAYLKTAAPSDVDALAATMLVELPEGGAHFGQVLGHVSEAAFEQLVAQCVERLGTQDVRDACESVIAYASLQFPHQLRPHLSRLFDLRPNSRAYYENWPWRGATTDDLPLLTGHLASPDRDKQRKAWECLMEMRQPAAMAMASAAYASTPQDHSFELWLREVGYADMDTPLFTAASAHIAFPADYLMADRPAWLSRDLHPTWRLPAEGGSLPFGGLGTNRCGLCGGTLHHLVTLPEALVFGKSAAESRIVSLEVCLSCLGWEKQILTYRHGEDGTPASIDAGEVQPEFEATALRRACVRLAPTPARWAWQDWALSNGRENLNRIGGYPCWVQSADFPDCLSCESPMRFVLQLDSELPTSDDDEWLWGSGGICYGFACARCRSTAFLWQCT